MDTAVEKTILFGSFARGDADFASDLDLVLIEPTLLRPHYAKGARNVIGHSAVSLLAKLLPDARAQADRALEGAGQVLVAVRAAIARIAP